MSKLPSMAGDENSPSSETREKESAKEVLSSLVNAADNYLSFSRQQQDEFRKENPNVSPHILGGNPLEIDAWFYKATEDFELPLLRTVVDHTKDYLNGFKITVTDTSPGPKYLLDLVISNIRSDKAMVAADSRLNYILAKLIVTREFVASDPNITVLRPYKPRR